MREFHIGKNDENQRLDRFLGKAIPLLPASLAQKYIRLKRIKVNGARAQRDQKLVAGDILQCYINDEFFESPSEENVYLTITTPRLKIVYEDENIRVTPFPTQHLASAGRPAYSYLVEAEGKKVFFSGDLSGHLERQDFPAYVLNNEVDLMVCEMAHFTVDEVMPYLEKCRANQVLFNHVFPLDKLAQIDALDGRLGYPIHTVNDNDEIEL